MIKFRAASEMRGGPSDAFGQLSEVISAGLQASITCPGKKAPVQWILPGI